MEKMTYYDFLFEMVNVMLERLKIIEINEDKDNGELFKELYNSFFKKYKKMIEDESLEEEMLVLDTIMDDEDETKSLFERDEKIVQTLFNMFFNYLENGKSEKEVKEELEILSKKYPLVFKTNRILKIKKIT